MERREQSDSTSGVAGRVPRRRPEGRRAHKVALTIAQRIVDDITEGELGPGTKLASEREMLLRFAAGRGTLRESLRFLEMSGAIAVKAGPHGGPIVGAPDGEDLARVLGLFLQLRKVPFKAIVDAREILEPELAGLAAERHTLEQVRDIEDSIEGMRAFLDDERNFLAENDHFHAAVATAAGNELFALLIESMHTITDGVPLGVSYELSRREAILRSHTEIYEAIRTRDAEGARWAMRKHMQRLTTRVLTDFPTAYEKPLRWRDLAP